MKIIKIGILAALIFAVNLGAEQIDCLSQIFQMGKGIQDADGDGFADTPKLAVVIPDTPNAHELAVASDLAARLNLESLAVDFSSVWRESDLEKLPADRIPVLIGTRLKWTKKLPQNSSALLKDLNEQQGVVSVFSHQNRTGVVLAAGSDKALLQTGRAFFLRWPYLWDIWGREQGETLMRLIQDLECLFQKEQIQSSSLHIANVLYDFPALDSSHDAVKRLRFDSGEIRDLTIRAAFTDRSHWQKAQARLVRLEQEHTRGENTDILSYAGCARISFALEWENQTAHAAVQRMGYPKRMLTPGYRSPRKPRIPEKNFDLLDYFSLQGAYGDVDQDSIPDQIITRMVLNAQAATPAVAQTATRLVLPTAGGSFPLVYLDHEIEEPKSLDSPLLVGKHNSLVKELIRTGKLAEPVLNPGQGVVQVVPQAFNKSNALVVLGEDIQGLEDTLGYFSRTFPYFTQFQDGAPGFHDIPEAISGLLEGKKGSAEAFLYREVEKAIKNLENKQLESLNLKLYLPGRNPEFSKEIESLLNKTIQAQDIEVQSFSLEDETVIFFKEKEFTWEADAALTLLRQQLEELKPSGEKIAISLGLSESPEVRSRLQNQVKELLQAHTLEAGPVEVLSAYKQGFFWLLENALPQLRRLQGLHRITIRFAREEDDLSQPKRFYSDPFRWLQELYPVDELIAQKAAVPLERITFEAKRETDPIYEILALDEHGTTLYRSGFSPRTQQMAYLRALPEWGEVKAPTGWLTIRVGEKIVLDQNIQSDLERFWDYYQGEVLEPVYDHILKKTEKRPTFEKQPYFKRLLIELWLSEPDYRLGLDEEIISSLEALHDEIYFDTLDFMRGITEIELEDEDIPEDSSRYSAPGNILPKIHPSTEGERGKVKVTFEDWQARTPQMELVWQEPGRHQNSRKSSFPKFKPKAMRLPSFVYDGTAGRIDRITTTIELSTEQEYLALLDILETLEDLHDRNLVPALAFPGLRSLFVELRFKDLQKVTMLPVAAVFPDSQASSDIQAPGPVPTQEIISPEMCLNIVQGLSAYPEIKSYIAGHSYEGRSIPVLEVFKPLGPYVSLARLLSAKPTLYMSGRQHANEVSATNYILRFAELLALDPEYKIYLDKVNFVLHPLENPDGAALAYELQKLTPFHSLHAGRYSALGIDIGYQTGASKPLLPEAKVRGILNRKWLPDIYLNLHGYPSHEWVQPFSGYAPYLFRDYWIPRGWFTYFQALSLPLYPDWVESGERVKQNIIQGMQSRPDIHISNRRFYERYDRWAARWQPHMNYLELTNGVNIYAKRRSSGESRLSERRRITYVEETPELMDETAQGPWLEFLGQQGLTYLKAHADYLMETQFTRVRIEEESGERIHISFVRKRPGNAQK